MLLSAGSFQVSVTELCVTVVTCRFCGLAGTDIAADVGVGVGVSAGGAAVGVGVGVPAGGAVVGVGVGVPTPCFASAVTYGYSCSHALVSSAALTARMV